MKYKPVGYRFLILALASQDGFVHDLLLSSNIYGIEGVEEGITIAPDAGKITKRQRYNKTRPNTRSQTTDNQAI